MTDSKLYGGYSFEQLRKFANNATDGPWTTEKPVSDPVSGFSDGVIVAAVARGQGVYAKPRGGSYPENDRKLIAAQRSALPALLDEVERLRAALTKAADQFEAYAIEHGRKAQIARGNGLSSAADDALAKAVTNERFANMCRSVLTTTEKKDGR